MSLATVVTEVAGTSSAMETVLVALGALVLFAGVLSGAVVWWYKTRITRSYLYGLAASIHKGPSRLQLRLLDPFLWIKPGRAAQRVAALQALGFEKLAGYAIEEIPNSRLCLLRHPATGILGVVQERPELGTWSDALRFCRDRTQPALASNIRKPADFFLLPGEPKFHLPEADEAALVQELERAPDAGVPSRSVTAESFPVLYETAYAAATDKRLLEPLEDYHIRRFVVERGEPCGGEVSEAEWNQIWQLLPLAIENELRLACASQFMRQTPLSAGDWQLARERLLVIHDRTPLHRLTGKLIYGAFLTQQMKQHLRRRDKSGASPRESFISLNASLPAWERYKKLGDVAVPVPADIYRAPLDRRSI